MATTPDVRSETRPFQGLSELVIGPLPRRPQAGRSLGIFFAFFDAVIILGAGTLAYNVEQVLQPNASSLSKADHGRLFGLLLCYAVLAIVCKASQGLYGSNILHSAQISRVRTLKSIVLASMIFILVLFLSEQRPVSAGLLALTMFLSLTGILTMQHALQSQNLKRIERGIGTQHVLIVGAGQIGMAFRRYLETHRFLGKSFCGFVDGKLQH
ncbi:MAG: nucleoside-diphosphate sugar epimerase/dehydratase, partial [Candidatus Angelobacter sp.]